MFGEAVVGMMFLVLVAYAIACFIIYHKIFKVYYFGSISQGIFREIIICFLAAIVLTGITIWFWYVSAIVLIIATLKLRNKCSEPAMKIAVTIGMGILIVFIAIAGIQVKKNVEQEETSTIKEEDTYDYEEEDAYNYEEEETDYVYNNGENNYNLSGETIADENLQSEDINADSDSYKEGKLGDSMKTYFFNYTVNSAYLTNDFEGYTPSEGNTLLIAEVTIKNTFKEDIKMYDTDFQAQWGSDGSDDFSVPITYNGTEAGVTPLNEQQLAGVYTLQKGEETTGLLIFEIPSGKAELSISYMEAFDDDSTGTTYFVYFTAEGNGRSKMQEEQNGSSEYILENSSSEFLLRSDIDWMDRETCRYARNEIYARHGRLFQDQQMQEYFNSCSWYIGEIAPEDFQESMLSDIEIYNRDLIVEYEKEMGYR